MGTEERGLGRDQVDVGEFPNSNSPSWRGWLLTFLITADQLKWKYQTCCQKLSESLMGAVFNAFLEAKLFVEVELERPSVLDLLSRTVQVIGVSQIELIEERLLLELRQRKEENISDYAQRVGAFKTLALRTFSDEHWASNCFSGLNDECLRDVVKDQAKITMIVRELVHQDSLVSQLDVLWAKLHQVRLFDAEAQAHGKELPADQEHNRVAHSDEGFQNIRLLTKEKETRGFADRKALYSVDNSSCSSSADQLQMGVSRAKTATDVTQAGRAAPSTTSWRASCFGCEDSDDEYDHLVWEQEGTVRKHHRRSQLWSYSSKKDISDEEDDELCSELYSDDDFDCPYELVTLEEALRQFDESKKAELAIRNHVSLTTPERSYKLMLIPETLMWNNEAAQLSSVLNLRPGEAIVQRLWVVYEVERVVQMDHIGWPERGSIESAIVRLSIQATATNSKGLSAERRTLSSERCSFSLEVRMELSQRADETWEVESGHCTTQAVECNFKAIEELADLKLECVKQGNRDCMCAQKTEAKRPSHGVQIGVVEDEPQWDPRHSFEVVWTTYQRVPDPNAGIKLTEVSGVRLKRKVWTSFLWFMTALWVQVNVLSDCGKSLPLNALLRCPNGWDNALWPSYVNWRRAASLLCEEDWVQHRQCLSPKCRWKATKWREGKVSHSFEQRNRSWIRHKRNPGAELMRLNSDSGDAKTSVPIVDMENNHTEVNEKLAEVSRVNPRGQILEGKPLSTPSRMMFIKLSRICPKHPCHETEMTSVRELRELSCRSLDDQARESHLKTWNSSKSVNMRGEQTTTREVYHRGRMKPDSGHTGQVMHKAISTPQRKWFCHPRAACDPEKRPLSRRVSDSGQCGAGAEQKRKVAVPSADSCSWISHRKHGRWKAEELAAQNVMKKMTYRVTTISSQDAYPKDCEMPNENW